MTSHPKIKTLAGLASFVAAVSLTSVSAQANDRLSFREAFSWLEKPLAVEIGDVTLQLRGSLEQAAVGDLNSDTITAKTVGALHLSAETQLSDLSTIGVQYSAGYDTEPGSITDVGGSGDGKKYSDNTFAFVSGVWGKVAVGNVSGTVIDETVRQQQVGNAALAFTGNFGGLGDWSASYRGRFGPGVVSAAIDEDANATAGLRFSRPLGNTDYGLAVRGTLGSFTPADKSGDLDTKGIIAIADVIYGSTLIDLGFGYETLHNDSVDAQRVYLSGGVKHKTGAITLSASGHFGALENNMESAFALGGRYDIARGLSANLGVNYANLDAVVDGVTIEKKDALEAILSMRYDF